MTTTTSTTNQTETLTLDGITYNVVASNTPESLEAQNLHRVAQDLRQKGAIRQLFLQRPKGRKIFLALQGIKGNYSTVTVMGV